MYKCLAAQSVNLKAGFDPFTSLISDYEAAYAIGTAALFMGIADSVRPLISDNPENTVSDKIRDMVIEKSSSYQPKNKFEENLLAMIREYVLIGTSAPEIPELLTAGIDGTVLKD